ncbi:ketopantoate reductase PanE/ApbA C terminal-domain-containing protein [Mrakia frigida]|uniref:ketopantoate reductase family protein n=1 Tax=Mrakia frigida TaxID=29902 RepID=UPI003FCBFD6D
MRVHVLGIGSIGTLLSYHLRLSNPSTPISLLLKSQITSDSFWLDQGHSRRGGELLVLPSPPLTISSLGAFRFNTELLTHPTSPILSLLVTLKCPSILPALQTLSPRLSKDSTIVLLHNGMGVYEKLIKEVFTNEKERPRFILGTTTHGVRAGKEKFQVYHHQPEGTINGGGELVFAVVPSSSSSPSSDSLDQTLTLLTSLKNSLNAEVIPYEEIQPKLLLKLVLNSIINPLTSLLSIPNGSLLLSPTPIGNPTLLPLIHQLATEASLVLQASHPSLFLSDQPSAFGPDALVKKVLELAAATSGNRSSMLQDLDAGRETEIEFINGTLVEMGRERGVETKGHEMVRGLVKAKEGFGRGSAGRV